jgi:hypothetical protein
MCGDLQKLLEEIERMGGQVVRSDGAVITSTNYRDLGYRDPEPVPAKTIAPGNRPNA